MIADHVRHSSVGRATTSATVAGIEPQVHVPPPSSARDLAVFEERLRSNVTYFRQRRRKYRIAQAVLVAGLCIGLHGGFLADTSSSAPATRMTYYLRVLFAACAALLVALQFRADYQRTMDQARMFAPRVNRVLHHFNVAFFRPGHGPELSFSKRIPIEVVHDFDAARQEIQRKLQVIQAQGGSSSAGKKKRSA
ncbi:hypothetical protein H9P43_006533 [Blastocladiella emersonii ATCC 22665]|nr:hypothetical protein H9P43_006533 [Blastocladiella emersonii ATCC 22665]